MVSNSATGAMISVISAMALRNLLVSRSRSSLVPAEHLDDDKCVQLAPLAPPRVLAKAGCCYLFVELAYAPAKPHELEQHIEMVDQKEYRGHGEKADQGQFHIEHRKLNRVFQKQVRGASPRPRQ